MLVAPIPKEVKNQIITNSTNFLHEKLDEDFIVTKVSRGGIYRGTFIVEGHLKRNPKMKFSLGTGGEVDYMFDMTNAMPNLHQSIIASDATDDWKPIIKRIFGDQVQDHFEVLLKDVDINKLIRQDNKTELNYKYSEVPPEYRIFLIGIHRFRNMDSEKTRNEELNTVFNLIDYVKEEQLRIDEIVIEYFQNKYEKDKSHTLAVKNGDLERIQTPEDLSDFLKEVKRTNK